MIRYCVLGLMISLGLCGGCKTTDPERMPPKLEFGRQVAVLKVSTENFNSSINTPRGKTTASSSYEVHVCLWDERLAQSGEELIKHTKEADWLRKSMQVDIAPNSMVKVLSSPQVSLPPNEWRTMEAIQQIGSTHAHTAFRVDGELLTIGSHPGLTLKAFVEPLENNRVRVKGAMARAIMSPTGTRYHAFPFDVVLEVGRSVVVYEREVSLSPNSQEP